MEELLGDTCDLVLAELVCEAVGSSDARPDDFHAIVEEWGPLGDGSMSPREATGEQAEQASASGHADGDGAAAAKADDGRKPSGAAAFERRMAKAREVKEAAAAEAEKRLGRYAGGRRSRSASVGRVTRPPGVGTSRG
ncbi:hypothetical protein FOA52_008280 [Chlamydomonas sp. UWO 241]|nr:hypothetical protein FOA52_008280 [Chlamydomonas sp. UWO 241]